MGQFTSTPCINCIYCDKVVNEGDDYSFINPHGDIVVRKHSAPVYICRYKPPIAGDWPQVSEDDWCGHGEPK